MATAKTRATFSCAVQEVWDIVASFDDCSWRSDLESVQVMDERRFIEYSSDGTATSFTVTAKVPCERLELDMENENLRGHWVGTFREEGGKTKVEFTEEARAKRFFMSPFIGSYLKKQQETYFLDLMRALLCPGAEIEHIRSAEIQ